jgi:hypothetical protein
MLFKIASLLLDLVCSLWYFFYISLDSWLKLSMYMSSKFIVGEEVQLYSFLMLAVDKGSRTGHFNHARCALSRRLGGPQSGCGLLDKTKTSFPGSVHSVKYSRSNCHNKHKVLCLVMWIKTTCNGRQITAWDMTFSCQWLWRLVLVYSGR